MERWQRVGRGGEVDGNSALKETPHWRRIFPSWGVINDSSLWMVLPMLASLTLRRATLYQIHIANTSRLYLAPRFLHSLFINFRQITKLITHTLHNGRERKPMAVCIGGLFIIEWKVIVTMVSVTRSGNDKRKTCFS